MDQELKKEIEELTKQIKEITAIYHYAAKKNGISDSEFCILYSLITMNAEYTQKDICDLWSFPKQTVNSGISSLARKNYITLENEEGIGNKKIIKLTKAGRKFGESVVSKVFKAEQKAVLKSTVEERKECIRLIKNYTENLKEAFYKEIDME